VNKDRIDASNKIQSSEESDESLNVMMGGFRRGRLVRGADFVLNEVVFSRMLWTRDALVPHSPARRIEGAAIHRETPRSSPA
jgi:hypothetical protein